MPISSKKVLPPNIQVFVVPVALLIVLGILLGLAFKVGFGQIGKQRDDVAAAKRDEAVLAQKESVLSEVRSTIPSFVTTVAASLPEKNPSLSMIAQLKTLALSNAITMQNLKVGSAVPAGDLFSVDIAFALEGTPTQVVDYLNSIKNLAPVSTVEKAKINQSGLGTRADITVRVYYSAFPEKLPALTESVKDLTAEERELLTRLSALSIPAFTQLQAQPAGVRENPFN